MANTNSYSENMARLTQAANDILEVANAVNETISGNDAEVVVKEDITFPSYQNVINRIDRAERTITRFTEGKGVVETDDGTYRKIRVETISRPANDVGFLDKVENFDIDPNWFFESLQYPRCIVKIDLAGKIEDDSDRVYVSRIIIDQNQARLTQDIKDEILNTTLSYGEFLEYLENNFIEYKEDKDEVSLPLTYERYNGTFQVNGINLERNEQSGLNQTWYYLSGISYSTVNDNGEAEENGNVLQVGDYLRFNNTLFKIKEINQTEMKVRLEYNVGYDTVGLYDNLELYNDPFKEKIISVGICVNEIDVVYIKGVNEKFNVLSREWSSPLAFDTNTLKFSKDNTQTFEAYYAKEVADFGRMWISQVKEGRLPAYGGKTPNAPTLNKDDLKVVQINTQLNATLDSERYNSITSEIASVKSNITATRNTIAANKNKLITEYDTYRRDVIKNSINTDTEKLNNFTTQFSSLVDELNTLLTDAGAINYTSKYHIRGFFGIPEPQYTIDDGNNKEGKQEIIAFEIMYRYLHTDETGTRLNTFTYNDASIKENGVFSDWSIMTSPTLEKQYNSDTDTFEWKAETLDGTHVTINQIDIPIRSGEKVEIKARSVSESGYPYSPLKSDWSNSVIIAFPDNLMTDDSVTTILKSVKDDMTSVVLQETLSAAGIYTHISDSNSQYKHSAENIEYTETIIDSSTGESKIVTMSLADKLRSLSQSGSYETPGVEFSVTNSDGSTLGGKIKISTPNMSSDQKARLDESITAFTNDTVIPYINSQLSTEGGGVNQWSPQVNITINNNTGNDLSTDFGYIFFKVDGKYVNAKVGHTTYSHTDPNVFQNELLTGYSFTLTPEYKNAQITEVKVYKDESSVFTNITSSFDNSSNTTLKDNTNYVINLSTT